MSQPCDNHLARHWQLNPDIAFLNHGSFGATPTVVLQAQREFQSQLEADPIEFLGPERELEPKLDFVRNRIARLVGAESSDMAFVRTATDGVNAVLRSFPLDPGDEIVATTHGYNACNNAATYAAERANATVRFANVPFPLTSSDEVVDAIIRALTDRTRLLLVDHVTSPTGLVLPLKRIIESVKTHNDQIRILVDGAHAPGMVPVDLSTLGADYYTANHHKWLCGPKVSGFLWVDPMHQDEVRPNVIGHAANRPRPGRSRFLAEFDWTGTFDPTPILAMDVALEFLESVMPGGLDELMNSNRQLAFRARELLCKALNIAAPSPDEMIGALVAVPLPITQREIADDFRRSLFKEHRIEVPLFAGIGSTTCLLRTSSQAYNGVDQYEKLANVIRTTLV